MKYSDLLPAFVQTSLFTAGIVSFISYLLYVFGDYEDKWFSRLISSILCLGVHYILKEVRKEKK